MTLKRRRHLSGDSVRTKTLCLIQYNVFLFGLEQPSVDEKNDQKQINICRRQGKEGGIII